ncbi:MAG: type II secretion system protein, partial [Thermoguttaceae bacterium]
MKIAKCKLKMNVGSGQWAVGHPEGTRRRETASGFVRNSAFSMQHSAFTLVELLVTIAIISILAGISLGAIRYARHAAVEAKTKATIAKLNDLVMRRYESYITRRVPIDTTGMNPRNAARLRYLALLDLMRMEMPERTYDIYYGPLNGPSGSPWTTARPALSQMYFQKYNNSQSQNPPGPIDNNR